MLYQILPDNIPLTVYNPRTPGHPLQPGIANIPLTVYNPRTPDHPLHPGTAW
jgi:hypothetical protein